MPGLTPGTGGGNEVMDLVYPENESGDPVGVAVLTSFTPAQNAEIRSRRCAKRKVDSEFRVVREIGDPRGVSRSGS